MFDGDVKLTNLAESFSTTARGDGVYDFHAGVKSGQYQLDFLLSKPGHPLDGVRLKKDVNFYGPSLKGIYGETVDSQNNPFAISQIFNFPPGGDGILCSAGSGVTQVLRLIGTSPSSFFGSISYLNSGGVMVNPTNPEQYYKYLSTADMKTLRIRTAEFHDYGLPSTNVIAYFGYVDSSGAEYGCGSLLPSYWFGNNVIYDIQLAPNERPVEITAYRNPAIPDQIVGLKISTDIIK